MSVDDLLRKLREQSDDDAPRAQPSMVMPFGKHKGERLEDIPSAYLEWALENCDSLSNELREEMKNQLALKRGEGVSRGRMR